MISYFIGGYCVLLLAAIALRWRYWVWFGLVLAGLVALASQRRPHAVAVVVEGPKVPGSREELLAELRARSWPDKSADIAPLAKSFDVLGDSHDGTTLRTLYKVEVANELAGDPPMRFDNVGEALAWAPWKADAGPRASPESVIAEAERRAVRALMDLRAPLVSGWPSELKRVAPLPEGAHEVAKGVWLAPRPDGRGVTVSFPARAHNHGSAEIRAAFVGFVVDVPDGAAGSRPGDSCEGRVHNLRPGGSQLFGCTFTIYRGDAAVKLTLDAIEAFRAGAPSMVAKISGDLDGMVTRLPDAEPLVTPTKSNSDLRIDEQTRLGDVDEWLTLGAIFVVGMLLPGLRGQCLHPVTTMALTAMGGLTGFLAGWSNGAHTSGVGGWEPIIALFTGVKYGAPFAAGLVFGNLAFLRQRAAPPSRVRRETNAGARFWSKRVPPWSR